MPDFKWRFEVRTVHGPIAQFRIFDTGSPVMVKGEKVGDMSVANCTDPVWAERICNLLNLDDKLKSSALGRLPGESHPYPAKT